MTQKSSSKKPESPPPHYSLSSPFTDPDHSELGGEILEEQVGGGRRYISPPVEHTPTKLRSHIKATDRDVGLVKEASLRRAMLVCDEQASGHSFGPAAGPMLTEPEGQSVVNHHQRSISPSATACIYRDRSPDVGGIRFQPVLPSSLQDVFYDPQHDPHREPQLPPRHTLSPFLQENTFDFSCLDAPANSVPGPSTAVPIIPETRIIPPTPTADKDWQLAPIMHGPSSYPDHHSLIDVSADIVPAVKGRRQDAANAALQEGFVDLERVIQELSRKTSLPTHQVISLWNKSHARVVNNVNHWNAYGGYFKDNLRQELGRLGPEAPESHGTPSATVRRRCYELFKASFPTTWQDILELHEEAAMLLGVPQTVAMRGQEFQKFCKRLVGMMDAAAARFGFEAALVACGKVVNQDGSLGHVHTTPGAAGFWSTRCKADDDTIIGHFKAQVYNLASLSIVQDVFDEDNNSTKENHPQEREVSMVSSDTVDVPKDMSDMTYVKTECSRQVVKQGGKFLSDKNFPWKTLSAELIRLRMMIIGYPEDVLLPGGFHTTANKSKGISNLTLKEVAAVAAALKAGTMQIKKVPEAMKAKLVTSEAPVLIGAPPAADSVHPAGRRLFANGMIDRQGPPRQKPSVAVTRRKADASTRKTRKAPPSHTSLMSLSDDDSDNSNLSDVNASPVRPIPPPSRKFKVAKPKGQKNEKKQEVISLVSSDAQSPSENSTQTRAEKNDSDYEDHDASRKRKARLEATSRASKKKVPSSEAKVSVQPKSIHVRGSNGKAQVPVRSKLALPTDAESSDDEALREPPEEVLLQPAKRLRDGPPQVGNTVPLQHAKRLRDGPPQVGSNLVKERPKPRPVTKPSVAKPLVEDVDSESTDARSSNTRTSGEGHDNVASGHPQPSSQLSSSPPPKCPQPSDILMDNIIGADPALPTPSQAHERSTDLLIDKNIGAGSALPTPAQARERSADPALPTPAQARERSADPTLPTPAQARERSADPVLPTPAQALQPSPRPLPTAVPLRERGTEPDGSWVKQGNLDLGPHGSDIQPEPGARMYDSHQRSHLHPRYESPHWTDPSHRGPVNHQGPGGGFTNHSRYASESSEYQRGNYHDTHIQHSPQPSLQYDGHGTAFGASNYLRGGYHVNANTAPYRDAQEGYYVGHRDGGRDHPEMFGTLGGGPYRDMRVREVGESYNGYQNAQHPSGAQYQGGGQSQYGYDHYNSMQLTGGNRPNILRTSPAIEHCRDGPSRPPSYNASSPAPPT